MCCHLSNVSRLTKYRKIQRISNKLFEWELFEVWNIETSDISNKIGHVITQEITVLLLRTDPKSVFNWCYPSNLFAYYLIPKEQCRRPHVGAARPGLTSSISYTATNLLKEIMNTLKLFCPAHPHNEGGKLKSKWNMQLKMIICTTMSLMSNAIQCKLCRKMAV